MVSTRGGISTAGKATKGPLKGKRLVRHHKANAASGKGPGIRHLAGKGKGSTVDTAVQWATFPSGRKAVVREEQKLDLQGRCKASCRIRPKHGHYKGQTMRDRNKLSKQICGSKHIVCEYKARSKKGKLHATKKHCRNTHAKHKH